MLLIERKHKNSINDAKYRSVCSLMQTKPSLGVLALVAPSLSPRRLCRLLKIQQV